MNPLPQGLHRIAPDGGVGRQDRQAVLDGLADQEPEDNPGRRAEGFNRVAVAAWSGS